ncbi:CheY-like chemotaxis protein [Azospirillum fermentarium]|uniref:response regulator n=1 Tax=Azospirillum fermentarium TaxID=1233114 RepID=UPI0022265A98|nr:response regulator [Azospirillum fermentarium]MCW2244886.1 CheY-like chemotaxis protein [Azospirillum fermentarium]
MSVSAVGPIIIVDDDPFIVEGLGMVLGAWGYSVVRALSMEALETALTGLETAPSLLITDHFLPGGRTGADVLARVRAHSGAHIPAILLTGDGAPERVSEAASAGFRLMIKPVSPAPLRAVVEELILRA